MRQQLSELRRAMQAHGIDLYIIPTDDFHASEYVGAHFRGRHYVPASRAAQVRWW